MIVAFATAATAAALAVAADVRLPASRPTTLPVIVRERPVSTLHWTTGPAQAAQAAQAAAAPGPAQTLATVKTLLAQLAADDYPTRERARVELMGLSRADLDLLRDAVKQSLPLQPSQVVVLRDIVTQIYLAGDLYVAEADGKGFLGVHLPFWGHPDERGLLNVERGVAVVSRLPGFCAYRMLQDGDVLLSLTTADGRVARFNTGQELIDAVTGVNAGQTVTFEVLRQGRVLEVPITLDRKPVDAKAASIEEFTGRREDQVTDLWDRDFAPLLEDRWG